MCEQARRVDEAEDARYGRDRCGDELPEELQHREGRLEKTRAAMARLEAEQREVDDAECDRGQARLRRVRTIFNDCLYRGTRVAVAKRSILTLVIVIVGRSTPASLTTDCNQEASI